MKKEMLINVSQPEECRIAIIEDGVLEELYIERASQDNFVGNIYKGRIVNLEPSIQAAFVDFGVGRNGFLHISDVERGVSGTTVEFLAISNRTYSVQYSTTVNAPTWLKLIDVSAHPTNRVERLPDPSGDPSRYYRLISPQTP